MNALNSFFKNLAAKIGLPDFFKTNTLIFNNLFLTLLALVCLIALILVIVLVPNKKKKATDGAEKSVPVVPAKEAAPVKEEAPAIDSAPAVAEQSDDSAERPAGIAPFLDEPVEEAAETPAAEPAIEEPVEETPIEVAPVEEQPVETPVEEPAPVEEAPAEVAVAASEESETKGKSGGKYEIVKRNGAFYFLLKANNGQLLLESSAYTSLSGAKGGIDTFKKAVENGEFSIDEDKNGNFKFILRASARSQMLYHGETYATRQRAESAVGSVKNFAFTDVIRKVVEDEEEGAAATPVETLPLKDEDHKEGGKYEIEERNGSFYFLLKANNGQLLLESPAFTTEAGAKSGIDTFKKAADTGFFVVDVDKKGKFRFILRASVRSQMRYYGESYSTRQSAENSVHSVRSFAQKAVLR